MASCRKISKRQESWGQFHLETCTELDEDSDATDPEGELVGELQDQSNFVEAATAIAEAQQLRLDYERRSMTMEDFRSHLVRNQ